MRSATTSVQDSIRPALVASSMRISIPIQVQASTAPICSHIAKKYGKFKCVEATKEMARYLKKKGIDAKIIHLKYINTIGYIVCNSTGEVISNNGNHYGIFIMEKYFVIFIHTV